MPEGHTIHRMARDHARWFNHTNVVLSSPQGRFRSEADALSGARFEGTSAHGKHLFYQLSRSNMPSLFIHIHLGLFGRFKRHTSAVTPSPNCRLRIERDGCVLDLSGPTCCEVLTKDEKEQKCDQLGPDPLGDGSSEEFAQRLARRRIPIGAALLDQKVIAGLGNIYRAELLFLHRINPYTPSNALKRDTVEALWQTAAWWLSLGVRANRIITTLDEMPRAVPRIPRKEAVLIYKKDSCPECGEPPETASIGNRKLFFCATCQQGCV